MENQPKNSIIAKLSLIFIRRFRVTILIMVGVLAVGTIAYITLLKREGFPPIQVPVVVIQTPYYVNNLTKVDTQITTPIENGLKNIDGISQIHSTSTANYSVVVARFDDDIAIATHADKIRQELSYIRLPSDVIPNIRTYNAAAIDGEHDLIITVSGDYSTKELQVKATAIATSLNSISVVKNATVLDLITTESNPITKKTFEYQKGFNRIGYQKDGQLVFASGISIGIVKKTDVGTLDLSKAVHTEIDTLLTQDEYQNLIVTFGGDAADELKGQVKSLEDNALTGMVTIIVVLFLFISWRAAIILGSFLPLTLTAVFTSLYLIGYTLNTISLFSLILVLGLFVDDGTVVVEAIDYYKHQGYKGLDAIKRAIGDIGAADIAGTLTTILAFLPMVFIAGILGDFIRLVPVTVILALGLSLIIAITILPLLSNILIPNKSDQPKKNTHPILKFVDMLIFGFGRGVLWLSDIVSRFIGWYTQKKAYLFSAIILSIALIFGGVIYATKLPFSIFPAAEDTESITATITFDPNQTINQTETLSQQVEQIIVDNVASSVTHVSYYGADNKTATMIIDLTPINSRPQSASEIAKLLQEKANTISGLSARIDPLGIVPQPAEYPFVMQVYSEDLTTVSKLAEQISDFARSVKLQNNVVVDKTRIDLTDVISRRDGKRFVEIQAKFTTATTTGLLLELQNAITDKFTSQTLLDAGLTKDALGFDFGQETENLSSFNSAIFALVIALVAMYGLLVIQFNSFIQPLLVFSAIPFMIPGLFFGLYQTNSTMSFFVIVGIIALMGIVVNNTIMLTEFCNHSLREGLSVHDAIEKAIKTRFRALLTTSVTTIAGLLPLALLDPFWEPLAFTVIFGLISSLILVIFIFPAYFVVFSKIGSTPKTLIRRIRKEN